MPELLARLFKNRLQPAKPRPEPEPKARHRLFFALRPEEETRRELAAALDLFPRPLSRNWTRPANLHIGLAALGGVGLDWLDDIKTAADTVYSEAFDLSLDCVTYWPNKQILCLTPSVVPVALERLAADLAGNLQDAGFDCSRRRYRPYLVLAGKSTYPPPEIKLPRPIAWQVDSFALVKSMPEGLGEAHELVHAWPLSRSQDAAE